MTTFNLEIFSRIDPTAGVLIELKISFCIADKNNDAFKVYVLWLLLPMYLLMIQESDFTTEFRL